MKLSTFKFKPGDILRYDDPSYPDNKGIIKVIKLRDDGRVEYQFKGDNRADLDIPTAAAPSSFFWGHCKIFHL